MSLFLRGEREKIIEHLNGDCDEASRRVKVDEWVTQYASEARSNFCGVCEEHVRCPEYQGVLRTYAKKD